MIDLIEQQLLLRKNIIEEISNTLQNYIYTACIMFQETLTNNGKIIIFDDYYNSYISQNIANKIIMKFKNVKIGLPALYLKYDPVIVESFNIDKIFEKQVETVVNKSDLLLGISKDGYSKNILRALSLGKNLGCRTVGISGQQGGYMSDFCDINIIIPSESEIITEEMTSMILNIIINSIKV